MLSTSFLSLIAVSLCVGQAMGQIATSTVSSTLVISSTTSASDSGSTSEPHLVHPDGLGSRCMIVQDNNLYNGAPVVLGDCNSGNQWTFSTGDTTFRLGSTNYCLDAGSTPGNGVAMKIWQCYDGLAAQHWYYTNDARIALAGQGLCVDLDGGNVSIGAKIQTWTCTDFNTNQIWTI